jgi:NADH-ubiquinone oxidoreductase chain 5
MFKKNTLNLFRYFNSNFSKFSINKKSSVDYINFVFLTLLFLLFLSIVSGYIFSDIFLGIGSDFFSKSIFINPLQKQIFFEKHFEIFSFKFIPLICSFFFFFFFIYLNIYLKKNKKIYYFFKLKIYFDFVFNFFTFFFL